MAQLQTPKVDYSPLGFFMSESLLLTLFCVRADHVRVGVGMAVFPLGILCGLHDISIIQLQIHFISKNYCFTANSGTS